MPWPERSPLPAGAGPSRACAFPPGGWGGAWDPPSEEGPEPALLEAINAAGAAGASRCRVFCARWGGRGWLRAALGAPLSPPLGTPSARGVFGPGRGRERPGTRKGPAGPGSASRKSRRYRKSLPTEVPPSATSGTGAERPRLHRGQSGRGAGLGPGPYREWSDRGGGRPFVGRGVPAVISSGSLRLLRVSGSGAGSTGPSLCPAFSAVSRGGGTGSAKPRGRPVPAAPSRSHGEPPALRGPHGDGAERQRGGGVRRPE